MLVLQEIDLKRDARRATIADIEGRLGETEELIEAREAVDDAAAALERVQRRQRAAETELEDLDAKLQPLETKLYDGSVRNPKELTDLQREVESLKGRRRVLDDQGLVLIESTETATKALEEAKQELEHVEAGWRAHQESLSKQKTQAEREHAELDAQRSANVKGMDGSMLGLYESLRASKMGRAVAKVERGTCLGCRISLPTYLSQRLRGSNELIQCPSCERILVNA